MTRLESAILANEAVAKEIQVTNRIEHLVLNELVIVSEATIVKNLVVVDDNRVIHATAACQAL